MVEKRSSAAEHVERLKELSKMEDNWDGDGARRPTDDAFLQAQVMLMLMEGIFDQDIMDSFFVVPFDGGLIIESFDPTVTSAIAQAHIQGKEASLKVPMSSFDTDLDSDGSLSFWYAENFYYEDKIYHKDYEAEISLERFEMDDIIRLWLEHAARYQTHMREKIDAAKE